MWLDDMLKSLFILVTFSDCFPGDLLKFRDQGDQEVALFASTSWDIAFYDRTSGFVCFYTLSPALLNI